MGMVSDTNYIFVMDLPKDEILTERQCKAKADSWIR